MRSQTIWSYIQLDESTAKPMSVKKILRTIHKNGLGYSNNDIRLSTHHKEVLLNSKILHSLTSSTNTIYTFYSTMLKVGNHIHQRIWNILRLSRWVRTEQVILIWHTFTQLSHEVKISNPFSEAIPICKNKQNCRGTNFYKQKSKLNY